MGFKWQFAGAEIPSVKKFLDSPHGFWYNNTNICTKESGFL